MRRIGFAVAVSLLVPLVGEAQQAGKVYRIGNLAPPVFALDFLGASELARDKSCGRTESAKQASRCW